MGATLGNLGNIMEANPADLSGGEMATRIGLGAAKGLGQGLQGYAAQQGQIQGRGGAPQGSGQTPGQPQIMFPILRPGKPGQGAGAGDSSDSPYFYGV